MERVNQILELDSYRKYLKMNEAAEEDRKFCHHDMGHFLDVARIAMILNEKDGYHISEELIYAAAVLHDIGRWKQYKDGTPHEVAGAELAPEILTKCGFSKEETERVVTAISSHRNSKVMNDRDLNGLLYRADKMSRSCFVCKEEKNCHWKEDKKNKCLVF